MVSTVQAYIWDLGKLSPQRGPVRGGGRLSLRRLEAFSRFQKCKRGTKFLHICYTVNFSQMTFERILLRCCRLNI